MNWQTEIVDEIKYDQEKKLFTFNTLKLSPFAYLVDRCTDYPYKGFQLRSVDQDKIVLDIIGKRDTYRFEIIEQIGKGAFG